MGAEGEDNHKLVAAKVSALLAIGVLSFVCGILPHYLFRTCRNRFPASSVHKVTSGVICFSGGTLLGVTFLHLMPEVREKIARIREKGTGLAFPESLPLSDIIAMSGFFGVYVLDELMHLCVEWYSLRVRKDPKNPKDVLQEKSTKICSQLPHEVSAFSLDKHENSKHQVSISRRSNRHANPVTSCICQSPKANPGDVMEERVSATSSQASLPTEKDPEGGRPRTKLQTMPHISGIITIAALSFHDVFEGMAVGVERELSSILFLYLSIASHKYAIAFCIGMDLVLTGFRLKMIVLSMMTFSVVSPIGVVLGMMVVSQGSAEVYDLDPPISVVLQGLAGGTLIYVVCFEVLQREGTDTHTKGIQNVVFVIVGFLVTLGFKVLLGHTHTQ
ncbi:UNVERIFIED_CONTAM: hypothetical protein PYX00_003453 [Menopon gallinae]|uniref:Zinc transporter ZIP3 n=1 Tax=Menopon gallinae TaxID=328185 RepID=A0AAW2I0P3_9NEOP